MAIKELKTRIALKYDSYTAWTNSPGKDLVLLAGEIGICEIPVVNSDSRVAPTILFKVGGAKYPEGHEKAGQLMAFKDLPWASAKAADVYSWAKSETVVLDGEVLKFKTGDTVNHSIDLSKFVTNSALNDVITRVEDIEAADAAQDLLIAANKKATEDETAARSAADTAINEKIGGSYSKTATVEMAIADAKKAGTEAAASVDTLSKGQVATNKTDIATNKADIAKLEADLDDEIEARTAGDKALSNRLDSLEAFFEAADHDGEEGGLTDALDTLKEIQEYLTGDGTTAGNVIGRIAANENAIEALQDLVEDGGDLEVRVDDVEAGIANLESIVAGYSAASTIKTAVDAAQADATKALTDADGAAKAAKAAQDDVDALERVVGDTNSGLVKLVNDVKNTADDAAANVAGLSTRMGTAEGNITTLQGIVSTGADSNTNLRSAITELQGIVKTGADANATLRSDLNALQDIINHNTTGLAKTYELANGAASLANTNASKIAAIEGDYLKAADEYIFNCGSSTTVVHTKAE